MPHQYSPAFVAHFWATTLKSADPAGCWVRTSNFHRQGYGQISVNGKTKLAHRVAWEITHDVELDPSVDILHECDNPPCVRHLFEGDQAINMADMKAKGRRKGKGGGDGHWTRRHPEAVPRGANSPMGRHPDRAPMGERNRHAKLTAADVAAIRSLPIPRTPGGKFQRGFVAGLADIYGITMSQVGRILRREVWRHLS